jgi:hypothetical protein
MSNELTQQDKDFVDKMAEDLFPTEKNTELANAVSTLKKELASNKEPGSVVYDTELIRKLEVTDATIHALKWVLHTNPKTTTP